MPKLRYKEEKKEKKRKHKSKRRERVYKPPTLYEEEEGWIPHVESEKKRDESEWREHLFEAMMEDEGQDPFYSKYEYSQPTPAMTEEEYRQHIVHGMYQRTHAEEIKAEEKRRLHKEKRKREKEELRIKMEKENLERIRMESQVRLELTKEKYDKKWKEFESLESIQKRDIPWPTSSSRSITFLNVKAFLIDASLSTNENKKNVRKEQARYHPDKFITKYMKKFSGTTKEREDILLRINEVSSWINEIWKEINQ